MHIVDGVCARSYDTRILPSSMRAKNYNQAFFWPRSTT